MVTPTFSDIDPELRASSMFSLVLHLQTLFEQTGDGHNLDQSIKYNQEVLDLWPEGHPNRDISLNSLANSLWMRSEQTGDRSDLDQSISYYQDVLNLRPVGHPRRDVSLNNLAVGLGTRFGHVGDRSDLDWSIKFDLEALNLRPEGHPYRDSSLNNLAASLRARFEQTGNRYDLDQSIKYHQGALNLRPEGHPNRDASLNNLANGLWLRFEQTGDRSDLNQCISYYQDALKIRPVGHPNRDISLDGLTISLGARFNQIGDRSDLDQSIKYALEALNLRPEGHPDRVLSFNNLASSLRIRFEQTGDRYDLDQSIRYHQDALILRPEGHPNRDASLNNLANGLWLRFEQTGDGSDLDQSISYYRDVLNLWPKGHPKRGTPLSSLAASLGRRFDHIGDRSDLDQSIIYGLEALTLMPERHPGRALSLNNLAIDLRRRFKQTGDRSELDQSIQYSQEALTLRPEGRPERALSLITLAASLEIRSWHNGETSSLISCLSLLQEGAAHEPSPVAERLRASFGWVRIGRQFEDPSTMEAYTTSISLLDRHIMLARSIGSRHSHLTHRSISIRAANLASDAASYALEHSQPEMAIELLERGRLILYSQLENYRTPLTDLEAVDAQLAGQFRVLSAGLERVVTADEDQRMLPNTSEDVVAGFQQTAFEWACVVERIRMVPGFSSFLKGRPFQELQLAALHTPVAIVNINDYRSDAIVLQHTGPPFVIPLLDATPAKIRSLSEYVDDIAANPYKTPRDLVGVLREIWRVIVEPVTVQLEQTLKLARGSRVCWMPTSGACSLPLHAAGLYAKGKRNMPERFISSYTPTLSMLLCSVAHTRPVISISEHMPAPHLLLVSQAIAEGQARLPGVTTEIERIRMLFPRAVTLDGEACTREAVLDGLRDAEWVHFACHGNRNQEEPFKSCFSMYKKDDPLTILDIIKHGRPNAQLAVLSACHSARGDKRTPDEAIHMAAGMQFSGFKSVVGTLWASADEVGPIVAEAFYKHMLRNGADKVDISDSAAALYEATKELRRKGIPLERWINFAHYGA